MSNRGRPRKSERRKDAPGLPDFMTVPELADLLRANPFTVRRWVHAGKLPRPYANGPNGRWLFDRAAVARWIAEEWTAFDNERQKAGDSRLDSFTNKGEPKHELK